MSGTGRHLRHARLIGAISIVLALGGCAVYHDEVDSGFSQAGLASLGNGAGIPVQVNGAVAGTQGAPLATAVAAAMQQSVGGTPVRYAPCAPYTECPGDHIVWTFGPPSARPVSDYAAAAHVNVDWVGPYAPSPSNVTIKVALFQGGNVVATAAGQADAPGGANDPAFKALIAEMSAAILSQGPLDAVGMVF